MKKNYKNISVISTGSWVPTDLNKKRKIKNTYKILINELTLDAFIGIHDFEKKKKQKISISLSLDVNDNISGIEHKIENFVSYEHIVADIKSILKRGHIDLLETLGEKIVDLCFKDERVMTIKLKLEKLEVFKETSSVGIEIFRKKNSDNNSIEENLSKAD
jgi:dihydroneopterin aldolase|tara:strand:- start:165 stop:647 length:483 start_codon:yes stop_codon:yes gene_type:complete